MKYFVRIINAILILLIPIIVMTGKLDTKSITKSIETKQVKSSILAYKEPVKEEVKSIVQEETPKVEEVKKIVAPVKVIEAPTQAVIQNDAKVIEEKKNTEVEYIPPANTYNGKMSGYGPDCKGCSGTTSAGVYVGTGLIYEEDATIGDNVFIPFNDVNIYYNDTTYGKIRIVAADKKIAKFSIIKISNAKSISNNDFYAIVLDRGGAIGFDKNCMLDLLFKNNKLAYNYGIASNVSFEVIRNGK